MSPDPAPQSRAGSPGDADLDRAELLTLVEALRHEVARLTEELRRARRDTHEVPPHYL